MGKYLAKNSQDNGNNHSAFMLLEKQEVQAVSLSLCLGEAEAT